MSNRVTAALVCESELMRQALTASLKDNGIHVVTDFGCLDGTSGCEVQVGLIHADSEDDIVAAAALPVGNWVVIGGRASDPRYHPLARGGRRLSGAPAQLGGGQIAQVTFLAASGLCVCLDQAEEFRHRDDADRIDEARLDASQGALMRCLAEGYSNKEIARLEATSEAAIKARVRVLLNRLNVRNRTQLAVMAARAGLRHDRFSKTRVVFASQTDAIPATKLGKRGGGEVFAGLRSGQTRSQALASSRCAS